MGRIFKITEEQYRAFVNAQDLKESLMTEIDHIATKSNVTVASLEEFKTIVKGMGITDSNVEKYIGQYCFIEVGSGLPRIRAEVPHMPVVNDDNGKPYDADALYSKGQWYFSSEHENVLKLEFDDNQSFNNKMPKTGGFDGKTPATAVKLSSKENIYGKEGFTFYYENGADFTNEMAQRLKLFVDNNISYNPNVKFVIHCKQGKSRSAAIGSYVAKKIGQFTNEFLSEYDKDGSSQFNIGMSRKKQPKYPHKNVMTKMGEIEGWSNPKKDTKEQWFYDTLVNHPETGYNAQRSKTETRLREGEVYNVVNEGAYVTSLNDKTKTAQLSYNKGSNNFNNNKVKGDLVKTDKMDNGGHDTYIVPLKGGINSYNITSISGTKVMRYFKHYFDKSDTEKVEVNGSEYSLDMKNDEFNNFLNQFIQKVGNVINYYANQMIDNGKRADFTTLNIYPVKSSSNFNIAITDKIISSGLQINGMTVRKVNENILKKDSSQLQKDEEFISKNADYYNSRRSSLNKLPGTHLQALNTDINKLKAKNNITPYIEKVNETFKMLYRKYFAMKNKINNGENVTDKSIQKLADLYDDYYNELDEIVNATTYYNEIEGRYMKQNRTANGEDLLYKQLKGTKPASVISRTNEIRAFLKGYINILPRHKDIGLCQWSPVDFQIKKFTNDSRMALQNMFKFDDDELQKEIEQIKNQILVIFDDNVSGGATLSDICYQYKKIGIENVIPITFGHMKETWGSINKPEGGFNL